MRLLALVVVGACSSPSAPPPPSVPAPAIVWAPRRIVMAELAGRVVFHLVPDCGSEQFDTLMLFTELTTRETLRVLVPCAELPRPRYSPSAGDAPVLRAGESYRLELSEVSSDLDNKADHLWRAERIDRNGVIEARSVGMWWGKPPMKMHAFEVMLHNPSHDPRWIVLPATFPYKGSSEPAPGGSEAELQWLRLSTRPRVMLAYGVSGNFLALRLAGDARVTIKRLWIQSWWEDVPSSTAINVLVAREVTIGGAPLATLAKADPTSGSAEVDGAKDAGYDRIENIWHSPASGSAPIAFGVESRAVVVVPLSRDQPGQ